MQDMQPYHVYSADHPEGRPMTPAEREASDRHAAAYGRYMDHAESAWQPVIDALRAEGVEVSLWQTGGGCLALGVESSGVEVMLVDHAGPIDPDGPSAYLAEDMREYATVLVGLSVHGDGMQGGEGVGIVADARWDDPTSWPGLGRLLAEVLTHAVGATDNDGLVEALALAGIHDGVEVYG